jgi:peptide deformylase
MEYSIVKRGSPVLKEVCQPVAEITKAHPIIHQLHAVLSETHKLYNFTRGSGVAAPQLGHLHRISAMEFDGVRYTLVNPRIVGHSSEKIPIREGCLSYFDYRGNVPRYEDVTVSALDDNGEPFTIKASGNFAMLLQHEIDHLDGILYIDRLPGGDADLYLVQGMPVIP